jgi:hypothetical protein
LEGWITLKMSRNPPHDNTIIRLTRLLNRLVADAWLIRTQMAIRTTDSQPEPNLAIVHGPEERYDTVHPVPTDVGLLVEVSDNTLARDRREKARIYARADIGCYWIVNLQDMQVEVHTDPTGPDSSPQYRQRQDFRSGESVPVILGGQAISAIPVADIFPRS